MATPPSPEAGAAMTGAQSGCHRPRAGGAAMAGAYQGWGEAARSGEAVAGGRTIEVSSRSESRRRETMHPVQSSKRQAQYNTEG